MKERTDRILIQNKSTDEILRILRSYLKGQKYIKRVELDPKYLTVIYMVDVD